MAVFAALSQMLRNGFFFVHGLDAKLCPPLRAAT